jgi:hypothetical protein
MALRIGEIDVDRRVAEQEPDVFECVRLDAGARQVENGPS